MTFRQPKQRGSSLPLNMCFPSAHVQGDLAKRSLVKGSYENSGGDHKGLEEVVCGRYLDSQIVSEQQQP